MWNISGYWDKEAMKLCFTKHNLHSIKTIQRQAVILMLPPVDGIDTQSTESLLGDVNFLNPSNECGKYNNAYIIYNLKSKTRLDPQINSQNQRCMVSHGTIQDSLIFTEYIF